jgi:uncharacterized protein (TIGR01777 family)
MRVLLSGGTGFVGSALRARLLAAGHATTLVGRARGAECDWSPEHLQRAAARSDAIVHLAGANLFARRWTRAYKQDLRDSRVGTTALLAALAGSCNVRSLLCASAVGYYGPHGDEPLDESAARGTGFLAELCADWEAACEPARRAGVRVAQLRMGLVLGRGGGALQRMLLPFRLGLGGPLGSGSQILSWIHLHDLTELFVHLLERPEQAGAFNATAPEPASMRDFAHALGHALRRPAFLPVPALPLRLAMGEVADVLLTGQRVLPQRALESGFAFRYPTLAGALADILSTEIPR